MRKRWLAGFLAGILLFSGIPANVFAEDGSGQVTVESSDAAVSTLMKLEYGQVYNSFDLDGDGKDDTFSFQREDDIEGTSSLHLNSYPAQTFFSIRGWEMYYYRYDNANEFLIAVCGNYGGNLIDIYRWENGSFQRVQNDVSFGDYDRKYPKSADGKTINFACSEYHDASNETIVPLYLNTSTHRFELRQTEETSGKCGDNVYYTFDRNTGKVTISGGGKMYDYESVPGGTTSPFAQQSWSTDIKSVEIQNGVTSVGNYAFYRCSSLRSVTIAESVETIGQSAFYDCLNLTSLTLSEGLKTIGESAFHQCPLEIVTLPSGVKSLRKWAFAVCTKLKKITIPDSVTEIDPATFIDDYYDAKNLTIYGKSGSYAERYARENNIKFIGDNISRQAKVPNMGWPLVNAYGTFTNPNGKIRQQGDPAGLSNYNPEAIAILGALGMFINAGATNVNWGGNCYGMSLLSCLAYNDPSIIKNVTGKQGNTLSEYGYSGVSSDGKRLIADAKLTAMIDRAQASRVSIAAFYAKKHFLSFTMTVEKPTSETVKKLENACADGPLMLSINTKQGGHIVVLPKGSKAAYVTDTFDGVKKTVPEFALYDPNAPQLPSSILEKYQNLGSAYFCKRSDLCVDVERGIYWYRAYNSDGNVDNKISSETPIDSIYDPNRLSKIALGNEKIALSDETYEQTFVVGKDVKISDSSKILAEKKNGNISKIDDTVEWNADCDATSISGKSNLGWLTSPTGTKKITIGTGGGSIARFSDNDKMDSSVQSDGAVSYTVTDNNELTLTSSGNDVHVQIMASLDNGEKYQKTDATLNNGQYVHIKENPSGHKPEVDTNAPTQNVSGEWMNSNGEKEGTINVETGGRFTDVPSSAYYYKTVYWALEKGITNGTSATTFSPNAPCTRGQMAAFLYKLAGSPSVSGTNPFTDVKSSAYYYKAVLWAVNVGLTSGTSRTTFSPNAPCTRGQMATFLHSAANYPKAIGRNPFSDVKDTAYYTTSVIWLNQVGITSGTGNGKFSPNAPCTRGQMATFLYNYSECDESKVQYNKIYDYTDFRKLEKSNAHETYFGRPDRSDQQETIDIGETSYLAKVHLYYNVELVDTGLKGYAHLDVVKGYGGNCLIWFYNEATQSDYDRVLSSMKAHGGKVLHNYTYEDGVKCTTLQFSQMDMDLWYGAGEHRIEVNMAAE